MLDPTQLRTFLALVRTMNFTRAAKELGVGQPTVSQHVRKLEATVRRPLFVRDTHTVMLTPDGEAMVRFAQAIIDTDRQAMAHFGRPPLSGRVRMGASEECVATGLARLLREFRRRNPGVDLELTLGQPAALAEWLRGGRLDLLLGERCPGDRNVRPLWREPLVWVGCPVTEIDPAAPVPLVLPPEPSITRSRVLAALRRHHRAWRQIGSAGSAAGIRTAVHAGLGVTACARSLVPRGAVVMDGRHRLPDLGEIEYVLAEAGQDGSAACEALAETIVAGSDRLRPVAHARVAQMGA